MAKDPRTQVLNPRIGGSFAPPLTDKLLDEYRKLCEDCQDRELHEYIHQLIEMADAWNGEDESPNPAKPHPSGVGTITELSKEQIERLWDLVPWPGECDNFQKKFDAIPVSSQDGANAKAIQDHKASGGRGLPTNFKPTLRSAAFHLLWFAKELSEDRQPLTNDKL